MPTYYESNSSERRARQLEDQERAEPLVAEARRHEASENAAEREHKEKLAKIEYVYHSKNKIALARTNERRGRLVVRCITLLALFKRPVPKVLEDLLGR